MKKYVISSLIVLFIICSISLADGELTFGEWAALNGLDGSEVEIEARYGEIISLQGLANNYPALCELDLSRNKLAGIEQGDFSGLSNVSQLDLISNDLTSIERGDFDGLGSLTTLKLHANQITSIEAGSFSGSSNLRALFLRANRISSVDQGDFAGLENLEVLHLGLNLIGSIERGDFDGLTNLQQLFLNTNQISSIEQEDFEGLRDLQELNLWNNQISSIEQEDFSELTNLKMLRLSGNRISSIEHGDFTGLTNLEVLSLGDNLIEGSIERDDFSNLSNLRSLSLNDNLISNIEDYVFAGMGCLESLYLGDNANLQILNFTGADFSSLNRLEIRGSSIEKVILTNAIMNQNSFNSIMYEGNPSIDGIAEISGVLEVDFRGVDFQAITDLSKMYTMDDLVRLVFADATNLAGDEVAELLDELASMNYLDVTGLWDEWFDGGAFSEDQLALMAWDQVLGNTLVVPEPMTVCLLSFGAMALLRKRKKYLFNDTIC